MKPLFRRLILGLGLALLLPSLTFAQATTGPASFLKGLFESLTADPAANYIPTTNSDVAFVIRYVGTAAASGTIQVDGSGNVLLKVGASGAEAADTTITGCGGTAGTLAAGTTPCNTLGGVIDRINVSANWKAVILDGFRADTITTNSIATVAATAANNPQAGVNINWNTTTALTTTIALIPERNIGAFIKAGPKNAVGFSPADPYINHRILFLYANEQTTFGSGTSTFNVYALRVVNGIPGQGVGNEPNAPVGGPSELFLPCNCTTPTPFYARAAGATTVLTTFDFTPFGLIGPRDAKLVMRVTNSAAMTATNALGYAVSLRYN